MKRNLLKRLRSRRGFTLGELLITLLIVSMVTGVVAAGIPSAARAYTSAVDSANAQMLLSTTMTLLRDELSTAVINAPPAAGSNSISYTDAYGNRARLYTDEESDTPGIYIEIIGDTEGSGGSRLLVSREAGGKAAIYARFTLGGYSDGLVSFTNLEILKDAGGGSAESEGNEESAGGKVLASTGAFQVRVISYSGN